MRVPTRVLPLLLALFAVTAGGPARGQALPPVVRVEIAGAADESLIVRDESGLVAFSSSDAPDEPRSQDAVAELRLIGRETYEVETPLGRSVQVDLRALEQPVTIAARVGTDLLRTAIDRFPPTSFAPGRLVRVQVGADGAVTVRHDASGDGTPDTTLAPVVSLRGVAANDRTPPVVRHERLPDGRHALRLEDDGEDVTAPDALFVSIDGGQRFTGYTGPFAVDPARTPEIVALGTDRAGNPSDLASFPTQAPFCERVAADRAALQAAIRDGLAAAAAAGELPASPPPAVLATGRAACLWRTGLLGGDASCDACAGVAYQPGADDVELVLFAPDAVPEAGRSAAAARLAALVDEPQRQLGPAHVAARARGELDAGRLALGRSTGDRDAGLARQLALLRAALTGEYPSLGAGAPNVAGPSLATLAGALSTASLPAAEGFEAGQRAELALLETGALVRIVGMGVDFVAERPARDGHLARSLRRQLEGAAGAVATAAAGLLAADSCSRAAGLLDVTRGDFRAGACEGAACGSFEQLAALRAVASAGPCAGLFSAEERAALELFGRLAARDAEALAGVSADDCTANAALASAFSLVRRFGERSRAAHDAALAAAAPGERAERQANAAFAAQEIAARSEAPSFDLAIELSNVLPEETPELTARLYVDDVSTGQERRLRLPPASRVALLGDARRGEPFFVRLDPGDGPDDRHTAVVVFDPENAMGRRRAAPPLSGHTFHRLDLEAPGCPPALPLRLPPDVVVPEDSLP